MKQRCFQTTSPHHQKFTQLPKNRWQKSNDFRNRMKTDVETFECVLWPSFREESAVVVRAENGRKMLERLERKSNATPWRGQTFRDPERTAKMSPLLGRKKSTRIFGDKRWSKDGMGLLCAFGQLNCKEPYSPDTLGTWKFQRISRARYPVKRVLTSSCRDIWKIAEKERILKRFEVEMCFFTLVKVESLTKIIG